MRRIVATISETDYNNLQQASPQARLVVTVYEYADAPPITLKELAEATADALDWAKMEYNSLPASAKIAREAIWHTAFAIAKLDPQVEEARFADAVMTAHAPA